MAQDYDIAVIGGGIAGLTAAHHAALEGASVLHVLGAEGFGGLVLNVGELEGYPAGPAPVSGIDLAAGLMEKGAALGVEQRLEEATALARDGARFRLSIGDEAVVARQVIAATGARLRMLDVPGARELSGRGVSQCAWCDAGLYKGKRVVVVGGGDAALEEALHLAGSAAQVTILARSDAFRARQAYVDRIAERDNVALRWMCDVSAIVGDGSVGGIRFRDREAGTDDEIACDGVFVFIGVEPNAGLLAPLVATDATGHVPVDASLQTETPGLFAIGALRAGYGGRLVHAAADGATAGVAAARRARAD